MNVTKLKSIPWNAPELRGSLAGMRYPAFCEVKLDGEFNFIQYNGTDIRTVNKYGTQKTSFPELQQMFYALDGNKVKSAILLCELYWDQGKAGDLYKLLSHKIDNNVHIHVFDVLEKNGHSVSHLPLIDRKEMLWEMVGPWQIRDTIVHNVQEIEACYNSVVSKGYEGIVVKSLDSPLILGPCSWVKIKYKDRTDYKVNLVEKDKERIEVLVPYRKGYPPGQMTDHIKVGVKASNRYKKYIREGDIVTVEHQGVLESGSLRHPVLIPKKTWK